MDNAIKLPTKLASQIERELQLTSSEETRAYTGPMYRVMLLARKHTPQGVPCTTRICSSYMGGTFS